MNESDRGKMNYMKDYAKYSSLIFQMVAIVALGVWGGKELDKLMNIKSSVFMITFTIFTAFLAIYHLFRTLLKK